MSLGQSKLNSLLFLGLDMYNKLLYPHHYKCYRLHNHFDKSYRDFYLVLNKNHIFSLHFFLVMNHTHLYNRLSTKNNRYIRSHYKSHICFALFHYKCHKSALLHHDRCNRLLVFFLYNYSMF